MINWEDWTPFAETIVLLVPCKPSALLDFCTSSLAFLPRVRSSVLFLKTFWCVWKPSPPVVHPVLLTVVFFLRHLTERVQRIWSVFARVWFDIVSQITPLLPQPDMWFCLWLLWDEQSWKFLTFHLCRCMCKCCPHEKLHQPTKTCAFLLSDRPTGVNCRATPWLKISRCP